MALRIAVPLAAYLAMASFAALEIDAGGAAESAYLALLVGAGVAAIAALAPPPGWEALLTATLAVAALWSIPYGPQRGAWITALLGIGLAGAALRRREDHRHLPLRLTVPLALGLQLLLRCDLLLPPWLEARTLVSLLVLPTVAGAALTWLAGTFGAGRAALVGAVAVVLAPGWNVSVTWGLVAVAAGAALGAPPNGRWQRLACWALLLAPPLWRPLPGLLLTLAGLSLVGRSWIRLAVPAMAVLAAVALSPARGATPALALGCGGLLLVPGALVAPPGGRWRAIVGAVVALAAARLGGGLDAAVGGLAVVASSLPTAGATAVLQGAWSAAVVALTGLFATFPWVRPAPRDDALALLGLTPGWVALLWMAGLVPLLGAALDRLPGPRGPAWRGLAAAAALVVVGLGRGLPATGVVPISYEPVILTAEHASWTASLPGLAVSYIVVDSNLIRGAELQRGTPVASVELLAEGDDVLERWQLRAGDDTAEWAAGRPDIAARAGFSAPPPWLSTVAPDGAFFARRFRARSPARPPEASRRRARRVVLQRRAALPADVDIAFYWLELRP